MNLLKCLEEYFKNTPKEQIQKDWNETEKYDSVGPTVEEYLSDKDKEYIEWVLNNFHKGTTGDTHWDGE